MREQCLSELKSFLRKHNYLDQIIEKGIEKARKPNIEELRSPRKENHEKEALTLVITNNPNNPQIIGKVRENLNFLNNSISINKSQTA